MNINFSLCLALSLVVFSCAQKKTEQKQEPQAKVIISEEEEEMTNTEPNTVQEVDHYICYTADNNAEKKIWIAFDEDAKAIKIKYEGQKEAISLLFDREEEMEVGAYPTIVEYYNEIYEGKQNGTYKLTHSGIWDYVEYSRGKDAKKFNFTIDHEANPYGAEPCF